MAACANNLIAKAAAGQLCKALGIRLCASMQMVQLAKNAGFDAVFIDLEHSTLSVDDASRLSCAGLLSGITPFVRVPYQCGHGFVQKVLDAGAMGIVFPHIHTPKDAQAAVSISKYPPMGTRSMTGQLPVFSLQTHPTITQESVMGESNATASSVILMIETASAIDQVDDIAAVPGVDALLIGSNDLAIELGMPPPSGLESPRFRKALESVGAACRRHRKILGLAGVYDRFEFQHWAVNSLGVRFMLCQQDSGLIAGAAAKCRAALPDVDVE